MDINTIVQLIIAIIMLISVILVYIIIKNNKNLNQNMIFNELIKQERELRIQLNEYRKEIQIKKEESSKDEEWEEIALDYDTLLFNYYEFLAVCLKRNIIDKIEARLYFRESLKAVKNLFDNSILFKEGYATKEQYKGIQWILKNWDI